MHSLDKIFSVQFIIYELGTGLTTLDRKLKVASIMIGDDMIVYEYANQPKI